MNTATKTTEIKMPKKINPKPTGKPNQYETYFSMGERPNGNRYRPRVVVEAETPELAEKKMFAEWFRLYSEYMNGTLFESEHITVLPQNAPLAEGAPNGGTRPDMLISDAVKEWIEHLIHKAKVTNQSKFSSGTLPSYRSSTRAHMIPQIGSEQIGYFTEDKVRDYMAYLRSVKSGKNNLTEKTVYNHMMILSSLLTWARKRGYIQVNPCDNVEMPEYDDSHKEFNVYDKEEIQTLLEKLDALEGAEMVYMAIFYILVTTGVRRGEAVALNWEDIDLDSKPATIFFNKSVVRSEDGTLVLKGLKLNEMPRKIQIPEITVKALRRYRDYTKEDTGIVFKGEAQPWRNPDSISQAFRKLITRFELPRIRLHDLRHTFASLYFSETLSAEQTSLILGHTSSAFTKKQYIHFMNAEVGNAKAANKLFGKEEA